MDRTKYWSMGGYILLFIGLLIHTIVKFVWYNDEKKQKDNKKKQNEYLVDAISSAFLSIVCLLYIIYLESLWGLFN